MSKSEENEKIINSAIDATVGPTEQQPTEPQTVTIPLDQYQALMQANLTSHLNTLNTLDNIDKIISSIANFQTFVMNIKENIKTNQLGLNKPNNQQSLSDKSNAQ